MYKLQKYATMKRDSCVYILSRAPYVEKDATKVNETNTSTRKKNINETKYETIHRKATNIKVAP